MGCRRRGDRSRLLRVVAGKGASGGDVALVPDPAARLPGRGAWLHPDRECLTKGVRRRAFGRALRVTGALDPGPVEAFLSSRELSTPSSTESGSDSDGHPMSSLQ